MEQNLTRQVNDAAVSRDTVQRLADSLDEQQAEARSMKREIERLRDANRMYRQKRYDSAEAEEDAIAEDEEISVLDNPDVQDSADDTANVLQTTSVDDDTANVSDQAIKSAEHDELPDNVFLNDDGSIRQLTGAKAPKRKRDSLDSLQGQLDDLLEESNEFAR
ncbi:hypothetical protein DL768_010878 [Monosporascus sp. mg162]|nr:hypothetical protein DL768_010878 [Monosporascus sp. mg162]